MSLVQLPTATIDDAEVACVLNRAVRLINPVVDALSRADPLGLKGRSHHLFGDDDGSVDKVLDALAWVLNTADLPGTEAWEDMDLDDRTNWWVSRVGALDTVLVAFPGVFGVVADRLPIQDILGFTNQAIVLCAVAREHGVDDYGQQVRLLASVMCDRDLGAGVDPEDAGQARQAPADVGLVKALWHLVGLMRAVGDELVKRPRPRSIFRHLGMLPAVGAVADYLGEYGALVRAAKAGRHWIADHPVPA
jgi:hypothetical protein